MMKERKRKQCLVHFYRIASNFSDAAEQVYIKHRLRGETPDQADSAAADAVLRLLLSVQRAGRSWAAEVL